MSTEDKSSPKYKFYGIPPVFTRKFVGVDVSQDTLKVLYEAQERVKKAASYAEAIRDAKGKVSYLAVRNERAWSNVREPIEGLQLTLNKLPSQLATQTLEEKMKGFGSLVSELDVTIQALKKSGTRPEYLRVLEKVYEDSKFLKSSFKSSISENRVHLQDPRSFHEIYLNPSQNQFGTELKKAIGEYVIRCNECAGYDAFDPNEFLKFEGIPDLAPFEENPKPKTVRKNAPVQKRSTGKRKEPELAHGDADHYDSDDCRIVSQSGEENETSDGDDDEEFDASCGDGHKPPGVMTSDSRGKGKPNHDKGLLYGKGFNHGWGGIAKILDRCEDPASGKNPRAGESQNDQKKQLPRKTPVSKAQLDLAQGGGASSKDEKRSAQNEKRSAQGEKPSTQGGGASAKGRGASAQVEKPSAQVEKPPAKGGALFSLRDLVWSNKRISDFGES